MDTNISSNASELIGEIPRFLSPSPQNFTDWGPKRDPLYVVIPITTLYAIIFMCGVVGNVSTCIVIARNKCMHTATNYYLFSLAISDLLLLVSGLPPEIYYIWCKYPYVFGEAFCVLQGFAAETSANATVLTITAFTVERYVAICHPFLSHTMSKLSRAVKFIVIVWVVAMCLAVPQAISFGIVHQRLPDGRVAHEDHYVCVVKRVIIPHAFEISTFVFFVAPMSMITVLYVLIGIQLRKSAIHYRPSRRNGVKLKQRACSPIVAYSTNSPKAILVINGETSTGVQVEGKREEGRRNYARNTQATKHVVKMLVAVVVAFFICWAPFHAQRLLAIYGQPTTIDMITAFRILTYISGVLYYLSTTINPLLYHTMSHRFREAFKDTFNRFLRRGRRAPGNRCYTTLSGRSSQINSHSNTDSCSRQSSFRYLDMETVRTRNFKKPLIVSFRSKKMQLPSAKPAKQMFELGLGLEQALGHLETFPTDKKHFAPSIFNVDEQCYGFCASSFDSNVLQPKHICSKKEPFAYVAQQGSSCQGTHCVRHEQDLSVTMYKEFEGGKMLGNTLIIKSSTLPEFVGSNAHSKSFENIWLRRFSCDRSRERRSSYSHIELVNSGNQCDGCTLHEQFIIHVN